MLRMRCNEWVRAPSCRSQWQRLLHITREQKSFVIAQEEPGANFLKSGRTRK